MAHELNNPLMFVKGFNGRIRAALKKHGQVSNTEIGDFVDEIESGTERMARIVNHFKDFSRQSNNEVKPVGLNNIITRAFDLFNEQLKLRNIEIHLQLSLDDPIIMGDANRLEQVILNLISNSRDALESTKESPKKIEVSTKVSGQLVVLKFSDNGVGIPPEKQMRIFDPFFTTKGPGKGTGLGLSISHGIIMDHRGSISVASEPGKATTFQISFPFSNLALPDEESGQGAA